MATPFLTRAALGLRPPRAITALLTAEGITAHYAGPSPWGKVDRSSAARFEATTDHARCATIWRAWQAFHMNDRGWSDIAYNAGICPHGWRLEGRGIGVRSAANGTSAGNRRSYAFCYLAGEGDPLTDPAREAFCDEASRYGLPLRWEHRDWKPTQCAGPAIRAWKLAGWPRPTSARPDSSPITEPRQEVDDDMWMVRLKGTPGHALIAPGVFKNLGQTEIDTLRAAGVEVRREVDRATWDRLRSILVEVDAGRAPDPHAILTWYAAATDSPLHRIVRDVVRAELAAAGRA